MWREHGAIDYVETIGDDVPYGTLTSFPRAVQAKDDEMIVFSWIVYDSAPRATPACEKVMTDPRMKT